MKTPFRGIEIKPSLTAVKGVLTSNLKLGITIKLVRPVVPKGEPQIPDSELWEAEYHFVKDSRSPKNPKDMMVTCVLCKSILDDPLKLCGLTKKIEDFLKLFENAKLTVDYKTYFEKIFTGVFPLNWYPCFDERNLDMKEPRWLAIKKLAFENIGKELDESEAKFLKERKDKEEAARLKYEFDLLETTRLKELAKKKDAEDKEVARKQRDKVLEQGRMLDSDNPDDLIKALQGLLKKK